MLKIIFAKHLSHDRMEIKIDVKDRRRSQNKSRCGSLLNRRMKDDKIMMTRNDLRVITGAIYFVC